jgi:hypothetical protein
MEPSRILHLTCGHRIGRREHRFVGSDGQRLYDTQKCLDIAEGRKPQKYGRDE